MESFHLTIASVGETLFDGEAVSATFPGSDGEFTVLAKHEPLISTLKKGSITVRGAGGEARRFDNDNGILECSKNTVTVLL